MSVNRYQPHVLVLPEDDANRQLANGFQLELSPTVSRQLQVLPVAGGWSYVLEGFQSVHANEMATWQKRIMVLLIDLDGSTERQEKAKGGIPGDLIERVFILGVRTARSAQDRWSRLIRDHRKGNGEGLP